MSAAPGRNDQCPCGSGRKFKHCCLQNHASADSVRLRLRGAEGRVIDSLLPFAVRRWGKPFFQHAWEDFWNYEDVPEDMAAVPEFGSMFLPWFTTWFVPDPAADEFEDDWPARPIAIEWLETSDDVSDADRTFVETACRSPMSVLVIEQSTPGRSLDVRDVLTGSRFHVLEQGASQTLRPADLVFARVITIEGASIILGLAPFVVPPSWHTRIIDWREQVFGRRLMSRRHLERFEIAIRDLYFDLAAELLDPPPLQLCNTDGDQLELTTLIYELTMGVGEAFEKLLPMAVVNEDEHGEATRDASGAITSADLNWVKPGNRQHKSWDNTVLGKLRLESGRLVADVNSARRAERLKREIAKRLAKGAALIDTTVVDPAEALAERARRRAEGILPDAPEPEPSPELQAMQETLERQHWAEWLDTRVPALGNTTPRQAVRTSGGRERLEALLAGFEREAEAQNRGMTEHLANLRRVLGLSKPPA